MTKPWPMVRLGGVLRRVERFEPRDEPAEYPPPPNPSAKAEG
jgi:hypothetical protein